jgi:hypothetical protein
VLTVLAAVAALAGCVPSEPSTADWESTARQTLEDTISQVESVALVVDLQSRDRMPGRSARVAAVETEDTLATTEQAFSALQPPPGSSREDAEVSDLLARATVLVRESRIALVADDASAYDGLHERLDELSEDLAAALAALS